MAVTCRVKSYIFKCPGFPLELTVWKISVMILCQGQQEVKKVCLQPEVLILIPKVRLYISKLIGVFTLKFFYNAFGIPGIITWGFYFFYR